MRTRSLLLWVVCMSVSPLTAGTFDAELLMKRYFRDYGQDRQSGKADILKKSYHPYFPKEAFDVLPIEAYPGNDLAEKEKNKRSYFAKLESLRDINFSYPGEEHRYEAMRIHYDGAKKRKDLAVLGESDYDALRMGTREFASLPFERYFDNGQSVTAILDQGPAGKRDPQVAITRQGIDIPPVHQYGRSRGTAASSTMMLGLIESGKYAISGAVTSEGYLAIAEATEPMLLSKVELLFAETEGDYVLKRSRQYKGNFLHDEEEFSDYAVASDGSQMPMRIISRRYTPFPVSLNNEPVSLKVAYEEETRILNAEFNIDIAESVFGPVIPDGATVFDTSVKPHLQYRVSKENEDVYSSGIEDVMRSLSQGDGASVQHDGAGQRDVGPNGVNSPPLDGTGSKKVPKRVSSSLIVLIAFFLVLVPLAYFKRRSLKRAKPDLRRQQ